MSTCATVSVEQPDDGGNGDGGGDEPFDPSGVTATCRGISPTEVNEFDTVTVQYSVTNTASAAATYAIVVTAGGQEVAVAHSPGSLDPGQTTLGSVEFSPGIHDLNADRSPFDVSVDVTNVAEAFSLFGLFG